MINAPFHKPTIFLIVAAASINLSYASYQPHYPSTQLLSIPAVHNIWTKHLNDEQTIKQPSDAVQNQLKTIETTDRQAMDALTNKVSSLLHQNLNQATSKLELANQGNSANKPVYFNPLSQQISDATIFINSVKMAASDTSEILHTMRELASEAGSGTVSGDDLVNINTVFEALKALIPYIQTAHLIDGDKEVSGGNLNISIGDTETSANSLVVNIPAFDIASLGLENAQINTVEAAKKSLDAIESANQRMKTVLLATQHQRIDDALTMLWAISSRLEETFTLLHHNEELAREAANGAYDDNHRKAIDYAFSEGIDTIKSMQTYVSLSGPKMTGQGSIHIRIGSHDLPENTLTIKLPISDVTLTGLENQDVQTFDHAINAMKKVSIVLRNIVYSSQ